MSTLVRSLVAVLAVGPLLLPCIALAQERPAAAVLETQASAGVPEDTAGAIDRMIRARLDGLQVVRTSSGVALDLSEVQLALGCVGETVECLAPVADELSVQLLLIPSLDQTDGELLLTIAVFDRQAGTIRRVVRQTTGERARTDLLDSIDGALRELFGLPAVAEAEPTPEPTPTTPAPATGPSAGPFVLMGVGVAALAVGAGLGVAFLDAQSEWQSAQPTDMATVDAANAAFDRAQSFAISADVLFVAGGLAAAGGLAWLLVELLAPSPSANDHTAMVAPIVTPTTLGLVARGSWEAR